MKENSATEPRRFSVYIINHENSIICPLFWYNEEHCNLIISNLKSSWTRMPNPFVFFHSMAFQDTKRGTSWGFCTHRAGRGTEPPGKGLILLGLLLWIRTTTNDTYQSSLMGSWQCHPFHEGRWHSCFTVTSYLSSALLLPNRSY